jgi:hypothetical protein
MEEDMEDTRMNPKALNRNFAIIGWGALLVWWGISFLVGPITIGMSAMGTGLILLGVNAARLLNGIPTNHSTTVWGVIALVWGALDHFLALSFESSFAAFLIVCGVVVLTSLLARPKAE